MNKLISDCLQDCKCLPVPPTPTQTSPHQPGLAEEGMKKQNLFTMKGLAIRILSTEVSWTPLEFYVMLFLETLLVLFVPPVKPQELP